MTGTALDPGDPRVIGPYRILARLGTGGMGDVFLGRSPGGRRVAIKAVHAHLAADPEFIARFGQEVTAARAVGGFCTAAVVDADTGAARPWMATEYIPAPTLKSVVAQHGPLPETAVAVLAAGIAEALGAIHAAGVVHRDLTPANVLVSEAGPRVIDFGIARALAHTRSLTGTGAVIGSPGYMSPEHISGDEVTPVSDVFSLGGVLVFALTGDSPFGTNNMAQTMYRVLHEPPRLDGIGEGTLRQVITACLAKDPALRPGTGQILAVFGRSPGDPVDAEGWLPAAVTTRADPERAGLRRRTVLIGAGLAGTLAVGAGAAIVARTLTSGTTRGAAPAESGPPAGTVLWKTDVGAVDDPVFTAPAVEHGRVYAGSIDGNVYALDSATGAVLWKADMGKELVRAPVVHDGTVFAAAFNRIEAFDAATGQRRWPTPVPGTFLGAGSQPPAVYAAPDSFKGVAALDPVTGLARWTALTQHSAFSKDEVATGPDVVAIVLNSTLYVLDPVTGAERWRAEADHADRAALAGSVVVLLGAYDGLNTRKLDSGTPLWTAARATQSSYAAAAAGTLYVGAESGKLYALDSANGDVRWLARTESAVVGAVEVRGDTLYGVWGGGVHAVDARTGAFHWSATVGGVKSAARVMERALFGYADQHVYAVAI